MIESCRSTTMTDLTQRREERRGRKASTLCSASLPTLRLCVEIVGRWQPSEVVLGTSFIRAMALLLAVATSVPAAEGQSWELSPYNVQVVVAVDPGLALAPDAAADLPKQAAAPLAAALRAAGRIESAAASPELRTAILDDLSAVTAADLPAERLAGDKALLVAVRSGERGLLHVQARELDVTTGLWNATIAHENVLPQQLASVVARSVLAAFALLARIETADGQSATLRLRGGALLPASRGLPGGAGTVYRPLLAKGDTRGKLEAGSARPIPWTYLTATSASGGDVSCRVDTGLAAGAIPPFHPQQPRLALAIAPSRGSTTLMLVATGEASAPLEGLDVLAQPAGLPGGGSWQRVGTSDARGRVSVPAGESVVQMLLVRQGERALARVPIVAGLVEEASLALADDSQRIELEQSLAELHDELVDLAVRREALIARAKKAKEANEASVLVKLTGQITALPDTSSIAAHYEQIAANLGAADTGAKAAFQHRLDALKKALDALAAQKPLEALEDPQPEEPKADDTKAGETKS